MPLIFIHGVNTRDNDPDYYISMAQRRDQLDKLVVAPQRQRYPNFAQLPDVYWGDLGVRFRWNLQAVPKTRLVQSLGPEDLEEDNPALLALVAQAAGPAPATVVEPSAVQPLGSATESHAFLDAVRNPPNGRKPGDVVRSIFVPEGLRSAPAQPTDQDDSLGDLSPEELTERGRQLSLMLQAAETVAQAVDDDPTVLTSQPNDDAMFDRIDELVYKAYGKLITPAQQTTQPGSVQIMGGPLDSAAKWVGDRLSALINGAKQVAAKIRNEPPRAASLLALQSLRDPISRNALRFLGDVFVYLYGGYRGDIATRVAGKIQDAWKTAVQNKEPLVVVTHSFGSIIFYDALTSGALDGIKVALWASAGAQTSLFAEMALYHTSDQNPPKPPPPLGKPPQIEKWINFYDAADVLSYLHQPIFGNQSVSDIEVREGANLTTAHGHYFVTASFYDRVNKEIP